MNNRRYAPYQLHVMAKNDLKQKGTFIIELPETYKESLKQVMNVLLDEGHQVTLAHDVVLNLVKMTVIHGRFLR